MSIHFFERRISRRVTSRPPTRCRLRSSSVNLLSSRDFESWDDDKDAMAARKSLIV